MPEKKSQYSCPKCGNSDRKLISTQHEGDVSNTFFMCNKCGHKALKKAFMPTSQMVQAQSKSVGSDQNKKAPSNKPDPKDDPLIKNPRDLHKRFRKREERSIMSRDPENIRNPGSQTSARRDIMNNPFIKESVRKKDSKEKKEERKKRQEKCPCNDNPFVGRGRGRIENEKKASLNPFIKEAREFRWTDTQKQRKNDKNVVFPESRQNVDNDKPSKGNGNGNGDNVVEQQETRFDTVDRKEFRNSPDPKDMIPGYKEWDNGEVDKYYDGWLDDHIENSGGKIVGSNTEKVMNLEDGEREHAPVYPTEAAYEKLLESRHELADDRKEMVASKNPFIKQASKKEVNPFVKKKSSLKKRAFLNEQPMSLEKVLELVQSGKNPEINDFLMEKEQTVQDIRNNGMLYRFLVEKFNLKEPKIEDNIINENNEQGFKDIVNRANSNPFCKRMEKTAAWEISMSKEGWENVDENLHGMSVEELAEAIASDDFAETADERDLLSGDISFYEEKKAKYLELHQDVLADEAYKRVKKNNTSDNGGHMVWIDKEGFNKVPVDNMLERIEEKESHGSQLDNQECGGSMFCDDSKISGTRAPFCPNKEHKGKKIKLIKNSPENRYFMCPDCKKVYYNKGNAIGEKQPEWKKV